MADVKMPETIPCKFEIAWKGKCGKPTNNGLCSEHENAKCCNCKNQATHTCDHAVSLICGCNLCDDCIHSPTGGMGRHVTKKESEEFYKKKKDEYIAIRESRKNPERRMDEELGVPKNLFELLKGDWKNEGWNLQKVYSLELKHGLMGYFPAVLESDDKRSVYTSDISLLEKVWKVLEPRKATINSDLAYVNCELNICYGDANGSEAEKRKPLQLLTEVEFNLLSSEKSEDPPFRWAFGLLGGRDPSQEEFWNDLRDQAVKIDPSFKPTD